MLGWMRSFVKSPWALVLFVLLVIGLVTTMGDPFQGVQGGGFVSVGDPQVHQRDVSKAVDRELNRIREESQGKEILTPRDAAQRGITQQVLLSLITRASLLAYADKIGVKASASAVTNQLLKEPGFKDALGRVNPDTVAQVAAAEGMTVKQFEQDLRNQITTQYIVDSAFSGLVPPDILTQPLLSYFGETRTVSLARFNDKTIAEPKEPTEEELRAWYTQHAQEFRQPERRRISILTYSEADFMDKVEVSEADIKAQYERRIREFSTPQTRVVAQFSGDRSALQGLVDLVKQGVALDQALSRSTGVTRTDLTVKPGDIAAAKPDDEDQKKLDDFVFGIPANTIQGPLPVGDAWYVVQVMSITEGVATPFEQVRDQIRDDIARSEARRLFDGTYDSFYDMAGGISLEEMSIQIGAPVIELAPIDATGRTADRLRFSLIDKHAQVVRGLFTLGAGQMTDVIEGEGERTIMRVDEIIPPSTLPFEEVREQVLSGFMREKIEQEANRIANEVVAAVKSGKSFEQAATASRLSTVSGIQLMRGGQSQIDPQVQAGIFNVGLGETAVVRGQGGVPWIVRVDAIDPVTPETAAMIKAQIEGQIRQTIDSDLQETFLRALQKEVKVNTNEGAINTYLENLTKDEAQ